jgi:hypothetical protein
MQKIHFFILLIALLVSCKKDYCSGNCADIRISGQVVDTSNNQGIANVPIQVYWEKSTFCTSCNTTKVSENKTDNEGYFNFVVTVDKDKFGDNYLSVDASIPSGYIHSYDMTERVVSSYISQYIIQDDNLRIVMYPRANLSIKLVKNQNDTFNYFDLTYAYSPTRIGIFSQLGTLRDTAFDVQTSADIYTKIEWRKGYGLGQTTTYLDSIKCSPTSHNTFIINY